MGMYVDPGNSGFRRILNSKYVDKTRLIELMNQRMDSPEGLVCVSRPRRFGKSYAAHMLTAYYDCSCDSHELFDDKEIARDFSYERHINKYHVISLDITGFISAAARLGRQANMVPGMIVEALLEDLSEVFPEIDTTKSLVDCLINCVNKTSKKFIFIIDEWDALIREASDDEEAQKCYLNMLREWFKNNSFTPKVVAAAYMTGILPIKKDGTQSAISDFIEYPVLYPDGFAEFTGFTEEEVRKLCKEYDMSMAEMKKWYDGYWFTDIGSIYNPYAVMSALRNHKCRSYWKKTSAAEALTTYINMNFDGLQEMIARLISGEELEVDTDGFENDFETFRSRDDVLTLLIHLGYLTYSEDTKTVRIPNEEIRTEFEAMLKGNGTGSRWIELVRRSRQLLSDTINGNSGTVAEAIKRIRDMEYAPTFYNNEQALRYVIKFAYIAALDQYIKAEELPSGHGIADVVYIPKRNSRLPALILELKWNRSSDGALAQIREKNYPAVLEEYGGDIVLAGIYYDERSNVHTCQIERVKK